MQGSARTAATDAVGRACPRRRQETAPGRAVDESCIMQGTVADRGESEGRTNR
jgi:hypothetical protein